MTIHQTYGRGPAHAVLCLNDLDTSSREPRVYDLTLARALGYEHARNVRRLIKSSRTELETHGELVAVHDRSGGTGNLLSGGANRVTPKAGRPGTAFYLNEGQALVICALTRTATAAKVRGELIRVFMLYRVGELRLSPKAMTHGLVPAERKALQEIIRHADVVLAPSAYPLSSPYEIGLGSIGRTEDGAIPYFLAPITHQVLETLAAFEADLADIEDSYDLEPNLTGSSSGDDREASDDDLEGDGNCDAEPGGDEREPSLGSVDNVVDQRSWSVGNNDDLEEQCEDEGGQCDDEGHDSDSEESLGAVEAGDGPHRHWENGPGGGGLEQDYRRPRTAPQIPAYLLLRSEVEETRKASQRLLAIVARLQGAERQAVRP